MRPIMFITARDIIATNMSMVRDITIIAITTQADTNRTRTGQNILSMPAIPTMPNTIWANCVGANRSSIRRK